MTATIQQGDERTWLRHASGLPATIFLGLMITANPALADAAITPTGDGLQCESGGVVTQTSHLHLRLRYLRFPWGSSFGPYFYCREDDKRDTSEQSIAYYCTNPFGYFPNVARCRVQWLTIYVDPEPVEPLPAG
jgi:hypothetical protein